MNPEYTVAQPDKLVEAIDEQKIISANKFSVLCLVTCGLYSIWWQYKAWRFFKQWQQSDIWPVARAIFSVFNVYQLLKDIQRFASRSSTTAVDYNSGNLASGYIILTLASRLPDPMWGVALGAFYFLIPGYKAFCSALLASEEVRAVEQKRFNGWQLFLLISFGALWLLVIAGIMLPDEAV